MENVNVEMDLRSFIRNARREVASEAAVIAQAARGAENEAPEPVVIPSPTRVAEARGETVDAAAAKAVTDGTVAGVGSVNGDRGSTGEGQRERQTSMGALSGEVVLSSRMDSRAAVLTFQRVFGVGAVSSVYKHFSGRGETWGGGSGVEKFSVGIVLELFCFCFNL